jgi:hypothetical protein
MRRGETKVNRRMPRQIQNKTGNEGTGEGVSSELSME